MYPIYQLQVNMKEEELWNDIQVHRAFQNECTLPDSDTGVTFWRHPKYPLELVADQTVHIRCRRIPKGGYTGSLRGKRVEAKVLEVLKTLPGDEPTALYTIQVWQHMRGVERPVAFHDPPPNPEEWKCVIVLCGLNVQDVV